MEFLIQLIVVSWTNCIKFLHEIWAHVSVAITCISEEAVYLGNAINHLTFSLILLIVNHLRHSPALFDSNYVSLIPHSLLIRCEILARINLLLFLGIFQTHLAFPLHFNLVSNLIIVEWLDLLFAFLVVLMVIIILGIHWLQLFRIFISEQLMIRFQADCATKTLLAHLIIYANLVAMSCRNIFLHISFHEPLVFRWIKLCLFRFTDLWAWWCNVNWSSRICWFRSFNRFFVVMLI